MLRDLSRRQFAASLGLSAAAFTLPALFAPKVLWARPSASAELPRLPIVPRIALVSSGGTTRKPTPIIDAAFLAEQLDHAQALFGPFGVRFALDAGRDLDSKYLALETRADRDALAAELDPTAVNIFFVDTLRDVDNPALYRMGVTWRKLTALKKKYVVVAANARPTTMAHELGHYFGLDHTSVKNNLMSYDRDGGTVFLDQKQGLTIRRHAELLYRSKELVPRDGDIETPKP